MTDQDLRKHLDNLEQRGLLRELHSVAGKQGREIIIDGRRVRNFCSNNYLGLAEDPRLVEAAIACMREQGLGAGASRLVCGNLTAHQELEKKLAQFKGAERSIIFSTGYMANVGIISALFERDNVIFCDRLNHASIIDGIILSRAEFKRYPHCDMEALEDLLKLTPRHQKKAIITDSVFSMDGDIAPLDRIVDLAKHYESLVMVDEAHALGVLGSQGKGAVEHFGLEKHIPIQMGTLSKAVGAFGAYCCGSADLINFLINKARSLIYTTGIPPGVAAAASRAIEIIATEPQLRERLWANTRYVHEALKKMGFNILKTQTPITPIHVGKNDLAMQFSKELFDHGFLVTAIRPPTVPEGTARLRMTITAQHLKEDLDDVLEHLEQIGRKLCIL